MQYLIYETHTICDKIISHLKVSKKVSDKIKLRIIANGAKIEFSQLAL